MPTHLMRVVPNSALMFLCYEIATALYSQHFVTGSSSSSSSSSSSNDEDATTVVA